MNRYKKRLVISLITAPISFVTLCMVIFSADIIWSFIILASFLFSSAYVLWFYTSWGKKYSVDIDNINRNSIVLEEAGWIIDNPQWNKFTQQALKEYVTNNKIEALKSIKSLSYWLLTIPFALLSIALIFLSFYSFYSLWLLPITILFLWLPNINIIRIFIPSAEHSRLVRWNKLQSARFVFGNYGIMLGNDYVPTQGNIYWVDNGEIEVDPDGDILLIIKTKQSLPKPPYTITDHRKFTIPVPKSHEEQAREMAKFFKVLGDAKLGKTKLNIKERPT